METQIIIIGLGFVIGGILGYFIRSSLVHKRVLQAELKAKEELERTETKAREILLEARNSSLKLQERAKREEQDKRRELEKIEERLLMKEHNVEKKMEDHEKMRDDLERKLEEVKKMKIETSQLHDQERQRLSEVAQLSKEQAQEMLLQRVEQESQDLILAQMKKAEAEVKAEAKTRARSIIADAIQRYAAETTSESTATIVSLPSDEMKGRIIGREGRNINTFEQITGIDVIVDDTPGSIVISGFDLVRRYIAKVALERLLADGRIHPARIEETVARVKEEVDTLIKDLGEKAAYEAGIAGLHPNLIKLLGRLKFRVSHGQNVLKHSLEVAFLAASLASEVGADETICRKAGLFHDIGKAVDHEIQGHHAKIGADILRKFGVSSDIVHAVEAHHDDPEPRTLEAVLVHAANHISNARPGANVDNLDTYIKRLHEVENVANTFQGIKNSYAIQAGREIRVIAEPEKLDDLAAERMVRKIAQKIEQDLQYPGQIKVTLIRETRAEEYAT